MMTTSCLCLVRVQTSNHILCIYFCDETMRVTMFRCFLLVFLAIMVRCCYTTFSCGDIILQDEECAHGVRNKENEETLKKEEDASQTLQLPFLRLQRFADVSSFFFIKTRRVQLHCNS